MTHPEQLPSLSERVNKALEHFNAYVRNPELEQEVMAITANKSAEDCAIAVDKFVETELAKSNPAKELIAALGEENITFRTALDDAASHYLRMLQPDPHKESATMVNMFKKDMGISATPATGTSVEQPADEQVTHDETKSYKPFVLPTLEATSKDETSQAQPAAEKPWYKKPAPYLWGALGLAFIGGISYIVARDMNKPAKIVSEAVKPEAYKPLMPKPATAPAVPDSYKLETPAATPTPEAYKPSMPAAKPSVDSSQLEQRLLANIFVGDGKEAISVFKELADISSEYGQLAQALGWNGKAFDDDKFTGVERSLEPVVQSVYGVFDDHIGNIAVNDKMSTDAGIKFLEHWERYSNTLTAMQQRSTLDKPAYEAMLRLGAARMIEHIPKVEE